MQNGKSNIGSILAAMAAGAGCMYLLDPVYGKRRRSLVRDKIVRLSHAVEDGAGVVARDLTNRSWGVATSVTRMFRPATSDDQVLEPRVRSEMGRFVSHPHAIHVEARDGCIILTGDILASEARDFLRHVEQVPGVRSVESHLRMHETTDTVSSLQGASRRESRFELMQTNWAPGPRLLAGVAGAAMIGHGIRNRGFIGTAVSIIGSLILFRAVTNIELTKLIAPEGREAQQGDSGVSIRIQRPEPKEYRIH